MLTNCCRTDMIEVLEDIKLEIQDLEKEVTSGEYAVGWLDGIKDSLKVIENRIKILKMIKELKNE